MYHDAVPFPFVFMYKTVLARAAAAKGPPRDVLLVFVIGTLLRCLVRTLECIISRFPRIVGGERGLMPLSLGDKAVLTWLEPRVFFARCSLATPPWGGPLLTVGLSST